jgi:transposase
LEITAEQFVRIGQYLPRQRGNESHENLDAIKAIPYVAENDCEWRALPKRFDNWHTIHTRMSRCARAGVLNRLQREQLIRIKIEAVSLDSTVVKVDPDGTEALKKETTRHRQIPLWLEHQSSYGCPRVRDAP